MKENFAEKIKKLRLSKNLTQEQEAKLLYVSRSAVAKWEHNRGFPNIETLQKISEIYEVSLDDLLSDKELEIIETEKNNRISGQRKMLIALSIILSIIIVFSTTLLFIYHPRTISKYIDDKDDTFSKIEIVNYDGETFFLSDEEEMNFLKELLNVNIVPSYFVVNKVVSSYTINIYYESKYYHLNGNYLYNGKDRIYFYDSNHSIYDVVKRYTGGKL